MDRVDYEQQTLDTVLAGQIDLLGEKACQVLPWQHGVV